jgi:exonuclease SbcC
MIIRRLHIRAFGGLVDKVLEFENGLNVVEGPNEAGKSTVYNAIQETLLTRIKLTKPQISKQMRRHIPLGGDTATVEIIFSVSADEYTLRKSWGAGRSVEFTKYGGSMMTDDDRVGEELARLLPASEGTCRAVLMSSQGGIGDTLKDLRSNSVDALERLGDLLRKAFMEADGVSVDRFKAEVQKAYDDAYGRWDPTLSQPEQGKGLENRWKNGTGEIVEAYYEAEKRKRKYEAARAFETELDRLNQRLEEATKSILEKDSYVKANQKAYADAGNRRVLQAEIESLQEKIEKLKKVSRDWPVVESKLEEAESELPVLRRTVAALEAEQLAAQEFEASRGLRERLARADNLNEELERAEAELLTTKQVDDAALERIRTQEAEIRRLESAVAAGKMLLQFESKVDNIIDVQRDLDTLSTVVVKAGDIHKLEGGGRLMVEHRDWKIEVRSGVGDIQKALLQLRAARGSLATSLQGLGAATMEDVEALHRQYIQKSNARNAVQNSFDAELAGDTLGDLKARVSGAASGAPVRSLAEVVRDLTNAGRDEEQKVKAITDWRKTIAGYKAEYGSVDDVSVSLGESSLKRGEREKALKELAPLPDGFADAGAFLQHYERVDIELREASEARAKTDREKAALEGKAPDQSADELEADWESARADFESALREGKAIARVKEATEEIVSGFDTGTFAGLQSEIAAAMARLTDSRYSAVTMDGRVPSDLVDGHGKKIPLDYLSEGTKDVLGLAIRLAMAKHFLVASDGFIMMDDPLVDLDPDRQKSAAQLLQESSETKQVIVFTCHPEHARVLGGNRISLG